LGKGGTKQCFSTRWVRAALSASLLVVTAMLFVPTAGAITPQQLANQAMRIDPRKPSDINLFTSTFEGGSQGFYPTGSAMQPASGPVLTEAQVRNRLKTYLQAQYPSDPAKVNAGLALFDGQKAKGMVPDPQLRAALVGMKGTVLEPTINHLLNSGRFTSPVRYGGLPIGAVAASTGDSIVFSRRYQSEDFRYLIGAMGHEVLHDDSFLAPAEEAINNALTAMAELQIFKKHPELAYRGTELARITNSECLIFLNSRENDSPNSEIYAPTGRGVAPGSPRNEHDIWSVFGGDATTSPASAPLGQITTSLGLPRASKFSLATAKTFQNLNDSWVSDVGRAQISVLLKLRSVTEISNRSGLSRSQVISKLGLQPYLDAQN
jgi:hypothetical protein